MAGEARMFVVVLVGALIGLAAAVFAKLLFVYLQRLARKPSFDQLLAGTFFVGTRPSQRPAPVRLVQRRGTSQLVAQARLKPCCRARLGRRDGRRQLRHGGLAGDRKALRDSMRPAGQTRGLGLGLLLRVPGLGPGLVRNVLLASSQIQQRFQRVFGHITPFTPPQR